MFGLFKKKEKKPFYKFEIGQTVNIHEGWEKPLGFGAIENRYCKYYENCIGIMVAHPIYLIAGENYQEHDLRVKE